MGYRKVDGVFWTDPKVRDLTEQERYLFLYCITCPSAHGSGIYYNPLPMIAYETCINEKALLKAFGSIEGILAAKPEELTKIKGITITQAEFIQSQLE